MSFKRLQISGYGDDLMVNNIKIGDLTPSDHEKIDKKHGGNNYNPLENVVVSHVKDSSTLICRRPSEDSISKFVESELIDGLCCYSAVNQGQLNETIVKAVTHHLTKEKLPTVPRSIRHKYMSAFLLAVSNLTKMDRVVPKVAGVESWELTFKLCRRWGYEIKKIPPEKAIIVGAAGNFHGRSVAAVSMSNDPEAKKHFGPFVPGIELVPFNNFQALKNLFEKKGEYIAAYLAEPIQGEAGVIVPDDDYWPKVSKLCKKYNILLALDEIQTGYGRTGKNFAHQLYGIKPDLMACGKAAGGGILPVSFVAGRNDVIQVLTPGSEGSTFGGYPLASVVAVYAIKALIDENLAEKALIQGHQLISGLYDIQRDFPDKIKIVRGKGLLTAFEMYNHPNLDGHNISIELLKRGIYAKETHKTTIRLAPALTISTKQINQLLDGVRGVIQNI